MSTRTHTAEFWAAKQRTLTTYTVRKCRDRGDNYEFSTTDGTGFIRSKADVGAPFAPGDQFALETVNWSLITGLMDAAGAWRFRLTDEDLADQAREQSQRFHDRKVVELEKNKAQWWAIEESLPDWIRARINRFRDAAGEKFLLDGWGYELAVAQLAVAYANGDSAEVDRIADEFGTSGNQHGMAEALANLHAEGRDDDIANSVSALAPLTGSADYS
ncbi:hypothetical protein JZX82_gp51 [Gordonia phage William]|uniref:Uncharacterized protein n=1 Tax=Gordonia phage William TaxID=2571253 RepID=A0A4Y6EEL8_9CAUD|nr:hypothetical protein JZX82_gp51 [Gordonia phage William]QDF17146.1 hypothetical protein SEA_WILLIAM_51 [Gordonia phage William]